jgi:hypothetical protein
MPLLRRSLTWTFERRNTAGLKNRTLRLGRPVQREQCVLSLFMRLALDYGLSALVYIDTHKIVSGFQWS